MKKSKTVSECKSEMLAIKAEIAKYNKLVSNEEDNFLNASSGKFRGFGPLATAKS